MFGASVIVLFKHPRETKIRFRSSQAEIPDGNFKAQCVTKGPGCALYWEINVEELIGGRRGQKRASHFIVSTKGDVL